MSSYQKHPITPNIVYIDCPYCMNRLEVLSGKVPIQYSYAPKNCIICHKAIKMPTHNQKYCKRKKCVALRNPQKKIVKPWFRP